MAVSKLKLTRNRKFLLLVTARMPAVENLDATSFYNLLPDGTKKILVTSHLRKATQQFDICVI